LLGGVPGKPIRDLFKEGVAKEAMTTAAERGPCEATLVFGGDTTPAYLGTRAMELGPDVYWPEIASLFREHDVAIVNLESPLVATLQSPATKTGPVLTGSVEFAGFLASSGVTAVTLANNHIMDAGAVGLESTCKALRQAHVLSVGAGANLAAAREPLLVRTAAGTIGVLSVAEAEFSAASAGSGGAAPLDEAATVNQMKALFPDCGVVIVVYHAGHEGYELPSPDRVRRCRALVDAGAAAVVCHHSHVVSGCEVYGGSVIAYGLGNLMFEVPRPDYPTWNTGALLSLRVRSGKIVEWRLIGTEQGRTIPAVRLLSNTEGFERKVTENSRIISNASELAAEFARFCRSSRVILWTALLGLNRAERGLVRRGVYPWWRIRHSALLGTLALIQCGTLREAMTEVLRQELGRRQL
jgi:hypothetical protein